MNVKRRKRASAAAVYDRLLYAYPRVYRGRHGNAMRETFVRDYTRVRRRGAIRLIPFWSVTVAEALWFGARQRLGRVLTVEKKRMNKTMRFWPAVLRADASYALRVLVRTPAFALSAVLSLAVGIAGATAVFAVADVLLFNTVPGVRDPDRVVEIARTTNGSGWGPTSPFVIDRLDAASRQFEAIAAIADASPLSLTDHIGTESVWGWAVSPNFFDVVGVTPKAGRLFHPDADGVTGAAPVVVLSHRLWRDRFGADPGVVGREIRLNGVVATVIGVSTPDFDGLSFVGGDLWIPTVMAPVLRGSDTARLLTDPASSWIRAVGRLAPGTTIASARAELNTIMTAIRQAAPSIPNNHGVAVEPLGRTPVPVRPAFRSFVLLLFALTAGLLAIVCSNVAAMLLARATTRRREVATRLALGAGRGRIVGQMLVETLVLFAIAGSVAVPLTMLLLHAVAALLPMSVVPLALDLSMTWRGAVVTAGVALAAGLVFGLAPARYALRQNVAGMLHGRSSTATRERLLTRHLLIVGQIAVSLALVITAGLFVRTLDAASRLDLGFQTANVDVVTIDTTLAGAASANPGQLIDRVVEHLRRIDGVEAVGHGFRLPLVAGTYAIGEIRLEGELVQTESPVRHANWDIVSPDYFRAIGLPLLQGREFSTADRHGAPDAAIVNEAFATRAWPDRSALGQRFAQDGQPHTRVYEVVGIVRDAPYQTIGEAPRPVVYVPYAQHPRTHVEIFVRRAAGPSLAADIRQAIREVEPGLPVVNSQTFENAAAIALFPRRAAASVAGGGGAVGLYLSAIGLYGLLAFVFAQRSREFALRIALGASPAQVQRLVLRQAAGLAVAGGSAGFLLAIVLAFVVRAQGLLFAGMPAIDPLTFGASGLLTAVVLLASALAPAWRVTRLDPARSLRAE
jgi:predicted permease